MKVLLLNGSPHPQGVCYTALKEAEKVLQEEGIETELIQLGSRDIRGCIACGWCKTHGRCVFNDIVNEVADRFREADGMIAASPTYYANANGTLLSFMERLFYSTPFDKSVNYPEAEASGLAETSEFL